MTQQVTEASRKNRTFFSPSHPPNPKLRDNMESVISLQVTLPLYFSFFIREVRVIIPISKNYED